MNCLPIVILSLLLVLVPGTGRAEVHRFTNKDGKQIDATLLGISEDWRMVKIKRGDGVEFEIEAVSLSLDDQQYIKDWIETGVERVDFRIEISLEKRSLGKDTLATNPYRLESEKTGYHVTVTNLSRETLPEAVVSYAVISREGVELRRQSDGDWGYRSVSSSAASDPVAATGTEKITGLAFNREFSFDTGPAAIESMSYDGDPLYEDVFLGGIVRVTSPGGTLLAEKRAGTAEVENVRWDEIEPASMDGGDDTSDPDPDPVTMPSTGPLRFELRKGDEVAVTIPFDDRAIAVDASVSPASDSDGTIVAIGGTSRGAGLYVKDKQLHAVVCRSRQRVLASAPLPLGDFEAGFRLAAGQMRLLVDGAVVASAGAELDGEALDGIEIGQDTGRGPVGDYDDPFPFAGAIDKVTVAID